MSKWNTFSGQDKKINSSGGLFAPVNDTYKTIESSNNAIDAAVKVSKEIKRNFQMCDRLPKQPVFRTKEGEVDVKDGVMGAMGEAVAELLDLAQTPKQDLSVSIGLGTSGTSADDAGESD